jgi:pseudaminic acid cytidylyltransferase
MPKNHIAIIPARGGSKRIPRKNIIDFQGRPIIGWVIETAVSSGCFSEVVVSSDDDEVLDIGVSFGAIASRRSARLSDDQTSIGSVATAFLDALNYTPDSACVLYATAALLCPQHLVEARQLLERECVEKVLSITTMDGPPERSYRLDTFQTISMMSPENFNARSQDLPIAYRDAGAFSWWKRTQYPDKVHGFLLPRYFAVDIDSHEDIKIAECFFRFFAEPLREAHAIGRGDFERPD